MTGREGACPVPERVRVLLGEAPLMPGESAHLYDRLLCALADEYRPGGIGQWLLVKDIADLTWEIQRFRWLMPEILHTSTLEASTGYLEARMSDLAHVPELMPDEQRRTVDAREPVLRVSEEIGTRSLLARSARDQMPVLAALEKILASLERRRQRYTRELNNLKSVGA